MCRVREDEEEADAGRDQREGAREEEAEVVEVVALPQRFLNDVIVF